MPVNVYLLRRAQYTKTSFSYWDHDHHNDLLRTYSMYLAQSEGLFWVMKPQFVMMVNMFNLVNNVESVVKETKPLYTMRHITSLVHSLRC